MSSRAGTWNVVGMDSWCLGQRAGNGKGLPSLEAAHISARHQLL